MDQSQVNVVQLQNREPAAWTRLLREVVAADDVVVTAVSAQPLRKSPKGPYAPSLIRYSLTLANHSDPITFIGKHTNRQEWQFYHDWGVVYRQAAPRCHFWHQKNEQAAWLILDDVPNHFKPERWTSWQVESILQKLAEIHLFNWDQGEALQEYGVPHFVDGKQYDWDELVENQAVFFEQGPGAVLSAHAIHHAGRLAETFMKAANGLLVMRSLDGWPGILGESHLAAIADLLDDPAPMLEPLRNLTPTLLHGNPHSHHWRMTLFGDSYLLDWHEAVVGPGVLDLVSFLEQFDLIYANGRRSQIIIREERPLTDETIIDTYLLIMSARLGSKFDARAVRKAIPAARCLHILTNWLPHFAAWFADMPNKFTWQKVNRLSDEQLAHTPFKAMVPFRPYLSGVFQRFLQSYRTL
jgi:hypothetical protein